MDFWESEHDVPTPLPFAGGLDTFLQGGFSNSIDQELNILNSVEKLKNKMNLIMTLGIHCFLVI